MGQPLSIKYTESFNQVFSPQAIISKLKKKKKDNMM